MIALNDDSNQLAHYHSLRTIRSDGLLLNENE